MSPRKPLVPTQSLEDRLRWLESIGAKPCICRYEWKSLGLHEGHGWVRMTTEQECLEHGTEAVKAWRERREAERRQARRARLLRA